MMKFAILKLRDLGERGGKVYEPIFEGADGELEREIASRVRSILGPKDSYTWREFERAINRAFKDYKEDFKAQTIKLK